jgi:hypothetical protein
MKQKITFFSITLLILLFFLSFAGTQTAVVSAGQENIVVADNNQRNVKDKDLVYAADIISISGKNFRVKRITSPHYITGRVNMPNYVMDLLETDGDTVAAIEFIDGSQLGINKNTSIEIVSATDAQDITKRGFVEKVVLKSGTMWAKISGRESRGFKVETGKGIIGVRGTEFIVETTREGGETVTVLEGEVEYSPEGQQAEILVSGDEIVFETAKPFTRRRRDTRELRDALNLRFPGLNPFEQAALSVFRYHIMGSIPGGYNALYIANQTMDFVENPEQFIADRAISEVRSRVGLPIPGISVGGRRRREITRAENLQPDGDTIQTYYPEFSWDKVEDAHSYRVIVTRKPLVRGVRAPGYVAAAQVEGTSFKYSPTARALKPGETYYWTVIPLNRDNKPIAPPSKPARLVMGDYQTLGIKGLYPIGEIEASSEEMVFDWTPVSGAAKYNFQVSTDENFNSVLLSKESTISSASVANYSSLLSRNRKYYWRAYPVESPDVSDFSCEPISFTIK